jgi:uncharacterized protein (DUF302 family)
MTMHAFEATVTMSVEDAEAAMRDALSHQGFGVVSEIDVAANLNAALGIARPPLKILGTCSPSFAQQALEIAPYVALLLPCNVVLEDEQGATRVRVIDPRALLDDERFDALAAGVAEELAAALDEVVGP